MVMPLPSKQESRVRFPPPAPNFKGELRLLHSRGCHSVAIRFCQLLVDLADGVTTSALNRVRIGLERRGNFGVPE